ncbi:ABC transporter substrate-binding protein [Pikeienuella sp. HZG-20]|uniref:ABC transporter substrate-binding protein n=1 Tax=Paludibacillus litoralis TaxID=3133267 RepID=UPI0030EB3814
MRQTMIACASAALLCTPASAFADKASDTLYAAFNVELENVDSYANSSRQGVVMQRAIWDGLLYRDPATGEYKGNLATSWEWIDDVTLELKLREGVTFHNGEPFDADDVVYTVNFIANPESGVKVQRNVNWLKSAEKLDQYTVRLHLKAPFPAAIEYLSGPISMYPNEYYAKAGFSGMGLNPVGTGPYKAVSITPGQHFVLEKNENYHDSPKGQPSIGKIDIRTIPDVSTQMAELFGGTLDLIWRVPTDQADKLAATGRFTVANASAMRIAYLTMDAAGRSGEDNPFTKQKVRQAVNHAINREELVTALVKGESLVINTTCFPSQFGCEQDVMKYEYNPEKAKALLAEAGYPDGFTTNFYAYRDRDVIEAVLHYLSEVGIKADLNMLQYPALRDLQMKGDSPISFLTWGSYSINDTSASTSQFFKLGQMDDARDEQVKAWLDIADVSTDPEVRKENYSKALKRIAEQAYWAPMFSYNTAYVYSKDIDYTPTPDEVLRFTTMKWK